MTSVIQIVNEISLVCRIIQQRCDAKSIEPVTSEEWVWPGRSDSEFRPRTFGLSILQDVCYFGHNIKYGAPPPIT